MEEIKFRAYDKNKKCMILNYAHIGDKGKMYVAFDTGEMDLEVMQYAGLRDKNGKEIYEGDIVVKSYTDYKYADPEFDSKTLECTEKLVVEYNNKKATYNLFDKGWDIELEVIGNIYENKELLS